MLILAHRGLPAAHRPENTVAACSAALRAGADGIEVDVRLSKDGVLVASHDRDLARVSGVALPVATETWSTLLRHSAAHGVELARVEQILHAAGTARVVLEAKKPPPGPSAMRRTAAALCEQIASCVGGAAPRVTVSSFSATLLREVRRLLPGQPVARTALLGRPLARPSSLLRQALAEGHDDIHPHVLSLLASPDAVATAHAVGVSVVPWTVNRRSELRRLVSIGVDAVITDRPATARAVRAATTADRVNRG